MPKLLKANKNAIQTRNRVRLYRGVRLIMQQDSTSLLNVSELKQKLRSREPTTTCPHNLLSDLKDSLRSWAIEKNIKRTAITDLLKILRSAGLKNLPNDSRSLLDTPRKVEIVNRANGKYWHNGLENCLAQVFSHLSSDLSVQININIDGLPLFKSSPLAFWPILVNVHGRFSKLL